MASRRKKGQLLGIEIHYFLLGFAFGLIGSLVLTLLGSKKIIPFQIPLVCGAVLSKKGQLEILEAKEFFFGFIVGFIGGFVLTYLGSIGTLPFKIPLVCG